MDLFITAFLHLIVAVTVIAITDVPVTAAIVNPKFIAIYVFEITVL